MSDFTSGLWAWFIGIATLLSFIAILWLLIWMSRGKPPPPAEQVQTMGHVWDGDLQEYNNPLPRWWLYMFYITVAYGAVYLVLYPGLAMFGGVLGWTEHSQYDAEVQAANDRYRPIYDRFRQVPLAELVNDPEAVKIGERLFSTYCTTCHGSDARGVRGFPNLRDNDWLYGGTAEDIEHTILNGRQGAMPGWEPILGYEGLFQVSEYVQGLSGRAVDSRVAAKGRDIYRQNCAVCHGDEGQGNQQVGAPNLADNIWLHGGSQKRIQETIAGGRNSRMPPHGEFLGEARVHLLAAYVFGLRVDKDIDY
ncbi:MAG: cytochrome-c oxidase, cbb3-type subunit III [Gammaproteobacteria bacterium]|nr:cytochrome-c oxidase, cbb3-type subunit III [Gammaproteobacteria bacterium]